MVRGMKRAPEYLILMGAVWLASAQVSAARQAAPVPVVDADPVEAAINHTRNLEYGEARRLLEARLATHPADLRALNYLASTILQREIFEQEMADGRVETAGGKVSQKKTPVVSEPFRRDLFDVLGRAESAGHARIAQNPQDQDALYWMGITHVIRAVYQLGFAKSNSGALKEAKEARSYHTRLLAINPGYVDAMLVTGMYDYIAGSVPWYMKVLTAIIGVRGDKQRGMKAMERVARDGKWAKVEARQFLAVFYYREKRNNESIALLEQLARDFPRNFIVYLHIARTYKAQNNWQKAAETYDLMVARYRSGQPGYQNVPAAKILCQAAEAWTNAGDKERARTRYAEAENLEEDSIFVYRAALATAIDLQPSRPEEARRRLERVATAVPWSDEGKAARQYLKKFR